ncbi:NAD(P)/FAD-dependent oxidoreductase [Arthrobacter sp. AZCC_0090]|uniref:flavin-containing monooxygenase n=1 Tax=Arthrobacter sp. AZCC_0090 TaxID=2735881 RepID=UPI001612E927|nr:NAD(P)/FAD-dependent oxidoreductase [Arthrobacter sp. AZCC_0090]MBB6407158.1 cation diffusion facilitator CzcD-associated flavoprotein CzcO [Arthrobacter sp. AZCC_0090]
MTKDGTNSAVTDYDVVVVGAGAGGIFAVHEFKEKGLSVLGLESGSGFGGVWFHNRYPGARVDVESYFYCYVDPKIYSEWKWSERYAAQPEILAYLNFAADKYDVRGNYKFSTRMTGAQWDPSTDSYTIAMSDGKAVTARVLVMATGQLSEARKPSFDGLDDFKGEWVQTSHWPEHPVALKGKRIAVIGTGSSGVQVIPQLAKEAERLYVFQRTANYSVPAQNSPMDEGRYQDIARGVEDVWRELVGTFSGTRNPRGSARAADMSPEEQQQLLQERWEHGGHTMNSVFTDQSSNADANAIVAEFVRDKVRQTVKDPAVAEKLIPTEYPIGSRRLCVDIGYYETYNRDNVTLVNVKADPIERITPHGIKTRDQEFEVDLIVFALGFDAFTGALDQSNIRNEKGEQPTDKWDRGPKTFLGLMTTGFPNLFIVTGPGSPSVLANMILGNMQHVRFIANALTYMKDHGHTRIEPTEEAQTEWTAHVADAASKLLRLGVENYMVHVNKDDQSRTFIPYAGGLDKYVARTNAVEENGYQGFAFA